MKTLIELYDARPIENILSVDLFRPEKVIYLCPGRIAENRRLWSSMEAFFTSRGIGSKMEVRGTGLYDTEKILRTLRDIADRNDACVLDITGGSDAALFAAGCFSRESDIPVFTYSRKMNRYYNIHGAEFVENVPVKLQYTAEDFFHMAGAEIENGRATDSALEKHLNQIEDFFGIFLRYRRQWKKAVIWFQKAAPVPADPSDLHVTARYTVKAERRGTVSANEPLLWELEKLGFIHDLKIRTGSTVEFSFDDSQTRFWLRDTGSVLELYTWKACLDAGIFNDIRCSTVIRWDDSNDGNTVTNEIDVFGSRGIIPVFLSCKVCAVDTDAINELVILKNRFGGAMAKACIISTEDSRAVTLCRASALGLDVIGLKDLQNGSLPERLRAMYY